MKFYSSVNLENTVNLNGFITDASTAEEIK